LFQSACLEVAVFASAQLDIADLPQIANTGVAMLVSHRPDHEDTDQPTAAEMAEAASAAGLTFVHAPVRGLPDEAAVSATARALENAAPGRAVVMFCRSGMRSSAAWAMARAQQGADPDALRAAAAEAGYDLSRVPL
jgi:uncharacterized protein (TIGR01244 family)